MNISAIPNLLWDPELKLNAKWPKPKRIPLSLYHIKIADVEILYNETSRLAFKELSEDTQTLKFNLSKNSAKYC